MSEPQQLNQADLNRILSQEYHQYKAWWNDAVKKDPLQAGQKMSYHEYLELQLIKTRQELQKYMFLNGRYAELMAAFPECPDKVPACIPHAIEWVKANRETTAAPATRKKIKVNTTTVEGEPA
jgi:hypothetical protein